MFFAGSVNELHCLIQADRAQLMEEVVCLCDTYVQRITASHHALVAEIKARANGSIALGRDGIEPSAQDAEALLRDLLGIALDEHAC